MAVSASPATVLHVQDYLETSRIYRLLLRDAGMVSAVARGVRRSGRTASAPPDLFATGVVQIDLRPGRDLHALREFDATRPRLGISEALPRFLAAGAIAEVALHFVADEPSPQAYDAVIEGLDAVARAAPDVVDVAALQALWRLVAALGFSPVLDHCASCGRPLPLDDEQAVPFHHRSGGVLCDRCALDWQGGEGTVRGARTIPASARRQLRGWTTPGSPADDAAVDPGLLDAATLRAHRRLLREFLREHLIERRELRAYSAWEAGFPV
ncbi:MAG: DNA repair protein RecO [Gemmatimonadaceae bacterium]|nr:DNA repair protein RecO [Gemmatimonadaceae bacterium]